MPFISEKDYNDIKFGCENGIDLIALSFVRRAEDILEVKELLNKFGKPKIEIIAKIENQEGLDNIDEILTAISYYNEDDNATARAIKNKYRGNTDYHLEKRIAFSSRNKISGMVFNEGTYLLGAPEFLTNDKRILDIVEDNATHRVLLLVHQKEENIPIALAILRLASRIIKPL